MKQGKGMISLQLISFCDKIILSMLPTGRRASVTKIAALLEVGGGQ